MSNPDFIKESEAARPVFAIPSLAVIREKETIISKYGQSPLTPLSWTDDTGFRIGMNLFPFVSTWISVVVLKPLQPFTHGNQDECTSGNRIAYSLSEWLLNDSATPHFLNQSWICALFDHSDKTQPTILHLVCEYESSELSERLGTKHHQFATVTGRGALLNDSDETDIRCIEPSGELLERHNPSSREPGTSGSPPQQSETVIRTRRPVQTNATNTVLTVEVC